MPAAGFGGEDLANECKLSSLYLIVLPYVILLYLFDGGRIFKSMCYLI